MSLFGKRRDRSGPEAEEARKGSEADDSTTGRSADGARSNHPPERSAAAGSNASKDHTAARSGPAGDTRPGKGATNRRSGRSGTTEHSTAGNAPTTKGGTVAIIGKSIIFKGELTGDEDLEIDGNVEGDIKLPNHVLKIGTHGQVKASVVAKCVQVIGHVSGDVTATERVEVEATGVVEGDIRSPRLLVQEGAVINGAIEMTGAAQGAAKKPAEAGQAAGGGEPARKAG